MLSNHVSWLDIVVIGSLRPLSFVAKSEIASWPVIIRARGAPAHDLHRPAAPRCHRHGEHRDGPSPAEGELVVLFAEGTNGDGNRLLPFRSALVGAARAALQAEAGRAVCASSRWRSPIPGATACRWCAPNGPRSPGTATWTWPPHLATFVQGGPIDVQWSGASRSPSRRPPTARSRPRPRKPRCAPHLTGILTGRGEAQPSLGAGRPTRARSRRVRDRDGLRRLGATGPTGAPRPPSLRTPSSDPVTCCIRPSRRHVGSLRGPRNHAADGSSPDRDDPVKPPHEYMMHVS